MTSEKAGSRVTHPAPQKTATTTSHKITQDADEGDGFFRKAMSGKVRPAPREPEVTHYGCDCCRWSA
jgi:hypothetical protein